MKKILLTVILGCFCLLVIVYSVSVQENLCDNLLRLHIIANSNTVYDQGIKYAVRDEILKYQREREVAPDIDECTRVANKYLEKNNVSYGAVATEEYCYIPAKSYKDIVLPGGKYNSMRVVLGEGKGENWWCIAYPPLCYTEGMFAEVSDDGIKKLESVLSEEALKIIMQNDGINFRFKVVDEVQRILNSIRGGRVGR